MTTIITPDTSRTYDTGSGGNFEARELPWSPGAVAWNGARSKAYRFVLAEDAAIVAGDAVCFTTDGDLNRFEVSNDRSGGSAVNDLPAGVALVDIPDGHYGWVQCRGLGEVDIVTDGGVAQGDELMSHASTDGGVDTNSGVSADSFGVALVADTGSVLAAGEYRLECPVDEPVLIA